MLSWSYSPALKLFQTRLRSFSVSCPQSPTSAGVTQGSTLGPLLFVLDMLSPGSILQMDNICLIPWLIHMTDPLADGWPGKGAEERICGRSKVKKRRRTDQTLVSCPEYIQTIFIQVYLKLPCEASLQALQSKTAKWLICGPVATHNCCFQKPCCHFYQFVSLVRGAFYQLKLA